LRQHALPVFVDTDPETFQMDARKLDAAITPQTKAIVPVHLGGNVADIDSLLDVAHRHKVPLIEDACQARRRAVIRRSTPTWGRSRILTLLFIPLPGWEFKSL